MTEQAPFLAMAPSDPIVARDGILDAICPLTGRNRITAAFYDGPGWRRFRLWERLFLTIQGGQARARRQILRHLPDLPKLRVLEVGIGGGDNLPLLPRTWEVHGVDIARSRLEECLRRFPSMAGRLAWAEGEALPYRGCTFDASYSIGGFNYFGDHTAALLEIRRVTKEGGPVIVADEAPWLHRCGIGHLFGIPAVDRWWLRAMGLDREFIDMVFSDRIDLEALFTSALPGSERSTIWHGLGYCVVDRGA
jgi:SAM-dependent methyltransferase